MEVRVLVGKQTTRGTAEISTMYRLASTDFGMAPSVDKTTSEALGSGRWERDGFVSKIAVEGDLPVEATREQLELLFYGAGFDGVADSVDPDLWLISPSSATKNYLTVGMDDVDNSMFEYSKDCLISSIGISASVASYVTATASMIGMDFTTNSTGYTGTEIAPKGEPLICLGTTIKQNGVDITSKVESIDINIDNKLEGKQSLNSEYYKAIRQGERGSVTISMTFNEFDKPTYIQDLSDIKSNNSYEIITEFAEKKNPTKIFRMTFPNCKPTKTERTDLAGAGGLTKEVSAYYDETAKTPIKIEITDYASIL